MLPETDTVQEIVVETKDEKKAKASAATGIAPEKFQGIHFELDVLRKQGFSALVAPVPNSTKWRTLVGPLPDAAAMAKTRTDLQAAGFKEVIVRKY